MTSWVVSYKVMILVWFCCMVEQDSILHYCAAEEGKQALTVTKILERIGYHNLYRSSWNAYPLVLSDGRGWSPWIYHFFLSIIHWAHRVGDVLPIRSWGLKVWGKFFPPNEICKGFIKGLILHWDKTMITIVFMKNKSMCIHVHTHTPNIQ